MCFNIAIVMRVLTLLLVVFSLNTASSTDHILTIGGGYAPEGNQASLEANVVFFQKVLAQTHRTSQTHRIQFADGFDPGADLQVAASQRPKASPAIELLREIFAPPGGQVYYRNHAVPSISGSNRISDVRTAFEVVKGQVRSGDRLLIYVTAHGGSAKKNEPQNTSITCWGNRDLSMQEFSEWLDTLPPSVPVVLVMAQCYCGGFAQTLFAGGDRQDGLASNVRTGFFAQRHDLPAAGCRPDVENDEEYSSFFWGGLFGKTRSGKPALDVDCNRDGRISLAEAHAFAVIASETIDIPLAGSDALLREFSRIADYESDDFANSSKSESDDKDGYEGSKESGKQLTSLTGTISELARRGSTVQERMVVGLAERLEIKLSQDVGAVFSGYSDTARELRNLRRGFGAGRRSRGGFGRRRDLRDAILEKWPELEEQSSWENSKLLAGQFGKEWLQEVQELPAHKTYAQSREQRETSRKQSQATEIRQVRFQRLIYTLESIVLAENLRQLAPPDVLARFKQMLAQENRFFD